MSRKRKQRDVPEQQLEDDVVEAVGTARKSLKAPVQKRTSSRRKAAERDDKGDSNGAVDVGPTNKSRPADFEKKAAHKAGSKQGKKASKDRTGKPTNLQPTWVRVWEQAAESQYGTCVRDDHQLFKHWLLLTLMRGAACDSPVTETSVRKWSARTREQLNLYCSHMEGLDPLKLAQWSDDLESHIAKLKALKPFAKSTRKKFENIVAAASGFDAIRKGAGRTVCEYYEAFLKKNPLTANVEAEGIDMSQRRKSYCVSQLPSLLALNKQFSEEVRKKFGLDVGATNWGMLAGAFAFIKQPAYLSHPDATVFTAPDAGCVNGADCDGNDDD